MIFKSLISKNLSNYIRSLSTKLAYVSDLHLEHIRWGTDYPKINETQLQLIKEENIHGIAILGDLSNPYFDNFSHFLGYCGGIFDNVYFVAGNHEYYVKGLKVELLKGKIEDRISTSIDIAKNISNNSSIHYLNNSHIQLLNNKILIGSTLWSDQINSILKKDNYTQMYKFVTNEHKESQIYLHNFINICKKFNELNYIKEHNVTILTHYLPTHLLIDDKYKHIYNTDRTKSERYYSNLDNLIKFPVKNWICGHSHSNNSLYLNGVYLGINSYISQKNNEINLKFVYL